MNKFLNFFSPNQNVVKALKWLAVLASITFIVDIYATSQITTFFLPYVAWITELKILIFWGLVIVAGFKSWSSILFLFPIYVVLYLGRFVGYLYHNPPFTRMEWPFQVLNILGAVVLVYGLVLFVVVVVQHIKAVWFQ